MLSHRVLFAAPLIAASLIAPSSLAAKKPEPEPQLPPPDVSVAVQAPTASGPWTLRVKNGQQQHVRIHADLRLLRLLVRPVDQTKYVDCALPSSMLGSPGDRELELGPGETWSEKFDPRLFCFGKVLDDFGPGTAVTAFWGYVPVKNAKKQKGPFVVEPVVAPSEFSAQKRLVSLTTWIPTPPAKDASSSAEPDKPAAAKEPESSSPPPGTPINTSRLVLEAGRFVDASSLREARVSATLRNKGDRDALIHVRSDQLAFTITSPDGQTSSCGGGSLSRAVVRDFFHTLRPKGSEAMTVLLGEACPRSIFAQPGVYEIRSRLEAPDDGSRFELKAQTGVFEAGKTTLLRLRDAKQPFYTAPPQVESSPRH